MFIASTRSSSVVTAAKLISSIRCGVTNQKLLVVTIEKPGLENVALAVRISFLHAEKPKISVYDLPGLAMA
jgi:hypothetical protein